MISNGPHTFPPISMVSDNLLGNNHPDPPTPLPHQPVSASRRNTKHKP